jgi:hypothetical protein
VKLTEEVKQIAESDITWVKGSALSPENQKHVLSAYVHRYTKEHKPNWASKEWKDGKPYPVHHASDKEWLHNSEFAVTKKGSLSARHNYCKSNPTWPDNPELRKSK